MQSEQIPNDGGYHVKRLVDEANDRLGKIGRRGKRAKIVAKKTSLTLQFTFKDGKGNPQKNVGLGGIPMGARGIYEAEEIAQTVTGQLAAGTFTWNWFNSLIGKDTSEQAKQRTCKEMVEQYKKHFLKQRTENKCPQRDWYISCMHLEKEIGEIDKPISMSLLRRVVERTENNSPTRTATLNGVAGFLKYFGNTDYKDVIKDYKANNNPKRKKRNVPHDRKIMDVYERGFTPKARGTKKHHYRLPQWQFLYGLLATYGLRVHEAWNIANWDKPVTLKNGDWVTIGNDDDNEISVKHDGEDLIVPAILDPDNDEHILCIGHDTKTGYRMASPISPEEHNWLKKFNLLQPLNLPDIKTPLKRQSGGLGSFSCTNKTCTWFNSRSYGFTPHDLRHAYTHRGHRLGFNSKALADSSGHSMTMSSTTYLRHMSDAMKFKGQRDALKKDRNKRSRVEELEQENKALKYQLEAKDNKIKMLEAELKAYRAIEESKRTNS